MCCENGLLLQDWLHDPVGIAATGGTDSSAGRSSWLSTEQRENPSFGIVMGQCFIFCHCFLHTTCPVFSLPGGPLLLLAKQGGLYSWGGQRLSSSSSGAALVSLAA